MKNEYKIIDDYVILYLKKRNGKIFETLIDLEDFNKIEKLNLSYHAAWYEDIENYYATASEYLGTINGEAKYKTHYLHKDIMNAQENEYVDHKGHNTLDNRKKNLRISSNDRNTKNRKDKNKNNTSGYRNVSKAGKWWLVQMQVNGKNTILKKFPLDKVDEAGQFAKEMREKYYGEFAGKG